MVLTQEEAAAKRWAKVFEMFGLENVSRLRSHIPAFGSLWFVRENIWKKALAHLNYDQNSDKRGHPGCSVREKFHTLGISPWMLYGTSNKSKDSVPIRNVFEIRDAPTFFGVFPPIPLEYPSKGIYRISPPGKSQLTCAEEQEMMTLCKRKGWL